MMFDIDFMCKSYHQAIYSIEEANFIVSDLVPHKKWSLVKNWSSSYDTENIISALRLKNIDCIIIHY